MMGKLIVPLLIGGGLLFMLSSGAQAAPGDTDYEKLPTPLKQRVMQAHVSQDPAMFDLVASELQAQGYPAQAALLRAQGQRVRTSQAAALAAATGDAARPQPASQQMATDFESLPAQQKTLVIQAYATQNPAMFEFVASQLDAQGYPGEANLLRLRGRELRAKLTAAATSTDTVTAQAPTVAVQQPDTAAPQPSQLVLASSPPPFVPSADERKPAAPSVIPAELQTMIDQAVQNGTVPVLTSTAFVVEKAGYPAAAEELRQRARDVAAKVPAPPPQDRPNVALDPNMPPDLALEVARQLQLQGDPNALEALAVQMRQRGFKNTADQLEAKAKQIRVMLDAARTMSNIDAEINSPGVVPPSPISQGPAPTASTQTIPPPSETIPVSVTATPPAPLPVPAIPQPQPMPVEKAKAQILAEAVASSLNDLIERSGSVPKARHKEDQSMVRRFQAEEGITSDGLYGPTSALHVARYVADVPPPLYWKKGAGQKDLSRYRSDLESSALNAEQLGNTDRAERLRASAKRASLA